MRTAFGSYAWDGVKFTNSEKTLWIGWSSGGYGNGPYSYKIIASPEKPDFELIHKARSCQEADVVRTYRTLSQSDVEHDDVVQKTDYVIHLEQIEKARIRLEVERARIVNRLQTDPAFLRLILTMELMMDSEAVKTDEEEY